MNPNLLIDEPPIAISPALIRVLGGHDLACFAQQVHYVALSRDGQERDGFRWAVRTLDEWCEAVVLTPKQARRVISALTVLGALVRWQPESNDRTAWSRIDYPALERLRAVSIGPNGPDGVGPKGRDALGPKGRDVPTPREVKTRDETLPVAGLPGPDDLTLTGQPEPTPNQCANDLMQAWWRHVEIQTGKPPVAVSPAQFIKLVAPFFAAGYERHVLKVAVKALHDNGTPLTRQTIERQLQGKGRRAGRQDVVAVADSMVFDAEGNLASGK